MTNDTNAAPWQGLGYLNPENIDDADAPLGMDGMTSDPLTDAEWHAREADRDAVIDRAHRIDTRRERREGAALGVLSLAAAVLLVLGDCPVWVATVACLTAWGLGYYAVDEWNRRLGHYEGCDGAEGDECSE